MRHVTAVAAAVLCVGATCASMSPAVSQPVTQQTATRQAATQEGEVSIQELSSSVRVLDTRNDGAPVSAGESVTIDLSTVPGVVAGRDNVVSLNVTSTESSQPGFVTVHQTGAVRPVSSNLNYTPGDTVANHVLTTTNSTGHVTLYVHGTSHIVVDVTAVHPAGTNIAATRNPGRVLDTRVDGSRIEDHSVSVRPSDLGLAGAPDDPAAWVLNITAVDAGSDGHLIAFEKGSSCPSASNLNFQPGQTIAGLATATANAAGDIEILTHGTTDLVVDVMGWVAPGGTFKPISARRALDTRTLSESELSNYYDIDVQDSGLPDDARSVLVNLTATESFGSGFLTGFRSTLPRPNTSMLNHGDGQTIANSAFIPVSEDGTIRVYTSAWSEVVVDIQGYVAGTPTPDPAPVPLTDTAINGQTFPIPPSGRDRLFNAIGQPDYVGDDWETGGDYFWAGWAGIDLGNCRREGSTLQDDHINTWSIFDSILPATLTPEVTPFIGEHPDAVLAAYPEVVRKPRIAPAQEFGAYLLHLPGTSYQWVVSEDRMEVMSLSNTYTCALELRD